MNSCVRPTSKSELDRAGNLAEIQGLYGPFSFPEKLLQKIWLRGEFDRSRALTLNGQSVQVLHPGRWNLLGGPDFKGARLRLGEEPPITGDVELHLNAEDWAAHGHARDPAYDGVRLHVVLFPPAGAHVTAGAAGREIPVLVLLPLLLHDLEEFAAEDAVENLANRPASRVQDVLGALGADELMVLLRACAGRRWRQKVHFARLRVHRLGWTAACHHAALEILGYRFNRPPMLRTAAAHPLVEWESGALNPDDAYVAESGCWSLQGVRPANHPRTRLRQYAEWARAARDWPGRLAALRPAFSVVPEAMGTGSARRDLAFIALREKISALCHHAVGGTRLDNLICDGFLPLLAAEMYGDLRGLWFHWFPGDLPPMIPQALRQLNVIGVRGQPSTHGLGQGLLGWLLEQERDEAAVKGPRA